MKLYRPVGAAVVWFLLSACADSGAPIPSVSVRDSAGIRIVENSFDVLANAPEWSLSPTPALKLGALEGEDPEIFHQVSGAVLLYDLVWVLDRGSSELRAFRLDGSHAMTTGREGEGPGEFFMPVLLMVVEPDTLVVWDQRNHRVSYFGPAGAFLRSSLIRADLSSPTFLSALDDGSYLFSGFRAVLPATDEIEVTPLSVIRHEPDVHSTDTVGVFPHLRLKKVNRPVDFPPVTFSPLTQVDGERRTFWVGTGEARELEQRDRDGQIVQLVRWKGLGREVRPEHVTAALEKRMARAQTERERELVRKTFEQVPVASEFPSLSDLVVDRLGRIWVQEYPDPTDDGPYKWIIFGEDGQVVATIRLPRDLRPREFGEDYVLGVIRGDFDEEYVFLFEIEKSDALN